MTGLRGEKQNPKPGTEVSVETQGKAQRDAQNQVH